MSHSSLTASCGAAGKILCQNGSSYATLAGTEVFGAVIVVPKAKYRRCRVGAVHAWLTPFAFALLFLSLPALGSDWRPIKPEELALKQSASDPNADAECLFREVRIENNFHGSFRNQTTNYIRFKIFNDRGREKYANRRIEYQGKTHVSGVAARTIHPDGAIIDVKKDAIFDKVEIKKAGEKRRVISFAFPAVESGSIVEYRWMEDSGEYPYSYMPLDVQAEYPVDEVTFHVKPAVPDFRVTNFGCNPQTGTRDPLGFYPFIVRNVPAYHDEPHSLPGLSAHWWILIDYQDSYRIDDEKYWTIVGKRIYSSAKDKIKISAEMKKTAADIASAGKTDDEKLALLAAYCHKNIKNVSLNDVTTEEREAYKRNDTSSDTFSRGLGTSPDMNLVFIALAQAAGYDARLASVADRRWFLFDPQTHSPVFIDNSDAVVQLNGKWRFFDVSAEFAPPSTLDWREQGVYALIPDPKDPEWVQTPLLTPDQTKLQRIADLTLSATGDIEGEIRELLWGNLGASWRIEHAHQNDAEQEAFVREKLKERYQDFEVKDIKITVSPDASRPVGISYLLTVRGFCQRTGKRIFLHPSFFTAGEPAYFTDVNRTNGIYFDYPWSESDTVEITLPPGFELDHAEAPPSFDFAPLGKYVTKVSVINITDKTADKAQIVKTINRLSYRRNFVFGNDTLLQFDRKQYKAIKAIFDQVHSSDEHLINLKLADTASASQ